MPTLSPAARNLLESDRLAHVVTLNADGTPHLTCVWVGLDGDEIIFASLGPWKKLQNLERDPRIVGRGRAFSGPAWNLRISRGLRRPS